MAVTDLVRCPLCGASGGYELEVGDAPRCWYVCCTACDKRVAEFYGIHRPRDTDRWTKADVAWNSAGDYAHRLRSLLERYRQAPSGADAYALSEEADEILGR